MELYLRESEGEYIVDLTPSQYPNYEVKQPHFSDISEVSNN